MLMIDSLVLRLHAGLLLLRDTINNVMNCVILNKVLLLYRCNDEVIIVYYFF